MAITSTKKKFIIELDEQRCYVCGACVGICPFGALELKADRLALHTEKCRECRWCVQVCPFQALLARPVVAV
jgi:Fe-S-cluster-containing hydrogenase component 2